MHLGGIEKNERAVSDPATVAARVPKARTQAQMRRDPTNRVVDLAVLGSPEVEDVALPVGELLQHGEDGVYAVVDVEVRLPLVAVAEHAELVRVHSQAFVEVKHMAVRVTLAE